jgi:hypothetical protein
MRSSSDHYPELTIMSNDKTQVRYNITEVTRTDMNGTTRQAYDYDYIELEGEVTKERIIEAILQATQPKPEPLPVEPELIIEKPVIDEQVVTEAILEADGIVKKGSVAISEALNPKPVKEESIKAEPIIEELIK